MPNGLFLPAYFNKDVFSLYNILYYSFLFLLQKYPVFNVIRLDPDLTLRSAASDLSLHFWPMSL